ncbi:uncharacterized protein SCHCODRAFT_02188216 [Schizophyllum commune H4-8]|uniref:uncharacterized protein n=1 Tax=Schizophyllum commune (strain H4-8 / FGSC 9210) TaxID=578458 RepID=UPI0021603A66|nr:uncharacterized protein SCHCODRAFT_02188216 [Schizophyllum commune H4-8]KAI5896300.1 hypothetical protein SCHCODRAFT_02188216 [Schizophyllum commune H4-8]
MQQLFHWKSTWIGGNGPVPPALEGLRTRVCLVSIRSRPGPFARRFGDFKGTRHLRVGATAIVVPLCLCVLRFQTEVLTPVAAEALCSSSLASAQVRRDDVCSPTSYTLVGRPQQSCRPAQVRAVAPARSFNTSTCLQVRPSSSFLADASAL